MYVWLTIDHDDNYAVYTTEELAKAHAAADSVMIKCLKLRDKIHPRAKETGAYRYERSVRWYAPTLFDEAVTKTMREIAPHCTRRGVGNTPNEDAMTVIFDCAGAARPFRIKATGMDMRLNIHRIAEFADIKARAAWKEFVVSGDDQNANGAPQ